LIPRDKSVSQTGFCGRNPASGNLVVVADLSKVSVPAKRRPLEGIMKQQVMAMVLINSFMDVVSFQYVTLLSYSALLQLRKSNLILVFKK
jgi:hypothetical protein